MPVTAHRQPNRCQPDRLGHLDAETVWRDLHGPLLGFITRRVSDRDTAEDILQEVMLRIHRHAAELTHVSAVGGWIHEIARNAITDHYRRAVVRRERPTGSEIDLERPAPAVPEPGPVELRAELAACLEPLLARLPAIYRDALRLTDLDGLTQAAAATQTGLSTSGMKTRVQRARAQLKTLLAHCCEIELDRRGGIIGYQPRNDSCCSRTTGRRCRPVRGDVHGAPRPTRDDGPAPPKLSGAPR
jgi:RNA polymerase sigma-70 factor (ECF subfamily)